MGHREETCKWAPGAQPEGRGGARGLSMEVLLGKERLFQLHVDADTAVGRWAHHPALVPWGYSWSLSHGVMIGIKWENYRVWQMVNT